MQKVRAEQGVNEWSDMDRNRKGKKGNIMKTTEKGGWNGAKPPYVGALANSVTLRSVIWREKHSARIKKQRNEQKEVTDYLLQTADRGGGWCPFNGMVWTC